MMMSKEQLPAGCVFYAPLTYNDLTDHVSGVTPSLTTTTSVQWDSTKDMYKFIASGQRTAACHYETNQIIDLSSEDCMVVVDMAEVSASGNNYFASVKAGLKDFAGYPNQYYLPHAYYYSNTNMDTRLRRYAAVYHYSTQKCDAWLDGVQTAANQTRTPTSMVVDCISLCFLPANNSAYTCYLKNVWVFNRQLTTTEIMAL